MKTPPRRTGRRGGVFKILSGDCDGWSRCETSGGPALSSRRRLATVAHAVLWSSGGLASERDGERGTGDPFHIAPDCKQFRCIIHRQLDGKNAVEFGETIQCRGNVGRGRKPLAGNTLIVQDASARWGSPSPREDVRLHGDSGGERVGDERYIGASSQPLIRPSATVGHLLSAGTSVSSQERRLTDGYCARGDGGDSSLPEHSHLRSCTGVRRGLTSSGRRMKIRSWRTHGETPQHLRCDRTSLQERASWRRVATQRRAGRFTRAAQVTKCPLVSDDSTLKTRAM